MDSALEHEGISIWRLIPVRGQLKGGAETILITKNFIKEWKLIMCTGPALKKRCGI